MIQRTVLMSSNPSLNRKDEPMNYSLILSDGIGFRMGLKTAKPNIVLS